MKIQYASDLHLEFPLNREWMKEHPLEAAGDVLILAGDICKLAQREDAEEFFDYLDKNFKHVYWVHGNHEYYGIIPNNIVDFQKHVVPQQFKKNIFLINNAIVTSRLFGTTEFIFSTLWSHVPPEKEFIVQQGVADYKYINMGSRMATVDDTNFMHANDLIYLKQKLEVPKTGTRIVTTHHVPTLMNYPERYKNSDISFAFATELHDLIADSDVDYWIYGHSHCNVPPFKIGNTTMLTNQLGYVRHNEHLEFNRGAIIEI
jgi:predicted phosphohydrolase